MEAEAVADAPMQARGGAHLYARIRKSIAPPPWRSALAPARCGRGNRDFAGFGGF